MDELLLDTTYLLPVFGIGTNLKHFPEAFPKLLERYDVVYNPVSLVEAKWVVIRLIKARKAPREELLLRFRKGLATLQNESGVSPTLVTQETVEEMSDRLLVDQGLPDYFDRLIYATACVRGSLLLTEDERMQELASAAGGNVPKTKDWGQMLKELN